ncbi:MAG: zinc metalloprotease HtpX [Planctomycetes bacterium]|nr:zinc metalloprotease HtpX [Planctomycetota bacterium]
MHTFKNNVKTAFLMGAMFGLVLLVGSMWGKSGLIMAAVFGGAMNVFAWFFSDKLAIAAMQAREVDAATAPDLHAMVDRLRQRAGLPMPKVYICPHDAPNAFATGRSPSKAAVAVTQGLLRLMDERELEGVIAHELAHIKHRDTLTSCIAATIAGTLATVAQMFMFFGGGGNRENANPLLGILTMIIAAVGAALIQAMISRTREFAADAEGAMIAGTPVGLAGALNKLDMFSRRIPLVQPNPAANNLFIVEPFGGGSLRNIFATHPPVEARIAALERLWQNLEARGR